MSKIIITDVKWRSEYLTKVQSLFVAEGYSVINEKDPDDLEKLLKEDMPALIVLGETLDFEEYLEFSNLKEFKQDLQCIPMICKNKK